MDRRGSTGLEMYGVSLCRTARFQSQCGCPGREAAEGFTSARSRAIGASSREHEPAVLSTRTTHDQNTSPYVVAPPKMDRALPNQSLIKKIPYRLAY